MAAWTDRTVAFLAGSAVGAGVYALVARPPTRSIAMGLAQLALRLRGKRSMTTVEDFRRRFQGRDPSPAPIPDDLRAMCELREAQVHGWQVFTLRPRTGASPLHLIYTHGGAYVAPLLAAHWSIIGRLIEKTGASATVPLYPLAPEHTYRTTYTLLEQVYREVTASTPAGRVVLCGDSAGGGLALGQALHYRDIGLPLPGRLVLFSPWLDITMSNPGAAAVEKDDAMLALPGLVEAGRWWAGRDDPRSPLLSPLFGDLSGLPPIDVFQGTHDLFIADARVLQERVTAAGGEIHLYEYPGAFHLFVGATFTPEGRDAFEKVAQAVATLVRGPD
jgi:monoterpene epsilon-lactone hydrolase